MHLLHDRNMSSGHNLRDQKVCEGMRWNTSYQEDQLQTDRIKFLTSDPVEHSRGRGNNHGNIGKLQRAVAAFSQSPSGVLQQESASELSSIEPLNSVEQTLKDVLTVLYDNAEDMHNMSEETTAQLREIAIRCPLDDGMGVYIARAALLKVDTLPKNYTNECEQIPHSDEVKHKTSEGNTSDWMVYPNPNNGQLVIEHNMALDEVGIVEVFDLSGRTVYQANLQPSSSNQVLQLEGLQPGLYLLRAVANGSVKLSEQISVIK